MYVKDSNRFKFLRMYSLSTVKIATTKKFKPLISAIIQNEKIYILEKSLQILNPGKAVVKFCRKYEMVDFFS